MRLDARRLVRQALHAADDIETAYANMPVFGLAATSALIPITPERQTAARIGARHDDQAPVEPY